MKKQPNTHKEDKRTLREQIIGICEEYFGLVPSDEWDKRVKIAATKELLALIENEKHKAIVEESRKMIKEGKTMTLEEFITSNDNSQEPEYVELKKKDIKGNQKLTVSAKKISQWPKCNCHYKGFCTGDNPDETCRHCRG